MAEKQFQEDPEIKKKMNQFLTEQKKENKDMNARINNEETLKALQLWRLEEKSLGIKEAGIMADTLERLSVSIGGEGRKEVVETIRSVPSLKTTGRKGGKQPDEEE